MQITKEINQLYVEQLRSAGLRNTHVRQAIFTVLMNSKEPLSIKKMTEQIANAHFVSVYRSVDAMSRAGILQLVPRGFKNLFEISDAFKPHHHHATCERCGKSTELQEPQLESLMTEITRRAGLTPTKHHFELFGLCSDCTLRQPDQIKTRK